MCDCATCSSCSLTTEAREQKCFRNPIRGTCIIFSQEIQEVQLLICPVMPHLLSQIYSEVQAEVSVHGREIHRLLHC